jgi:hypothetical protein
MKLRHVTIIAGTAVAVGCLIIFRGCVSERGPKDFSRRVGEVGEAIATSLSNSMAQGVSVAQDLTYTVAAFRRKQDRWPKDYEELRGFVQQSNGYLVLGAYSRVDLTNLPADRLELRFVPEGQTNSFTLRFEAPPKQ